MSIERLTKRRSDNGLAYLAKVKVTEQNVESPYPNTLKAIFECFQRLAAYEDALTTADGVMSPEEVSEKLKQFSLLESSNKILHNAHHRVCDENAVLKKALELAMQDIPRNCATCKNWQKDVYHTGVCYNCFHVENTWEWRGERQAKEALQK